MEGRVLLDILLLLTVIISLGYSKSIPKRRTCARYFDGRTSSYDNDDSYQEYDDQSNQNFKELSNPTLSSDVSIEDVIDDIEICQAEFDTCFSLWKTDVNGTHIIRQGCWKLSENSGPCQQDACISTSYTGSPNMHYCCCSGELCNRNMTVDYSRYRIIPVGIVSSSMDDLSNVHQSSRFGSTTGANGLKPFWMSPIFFVCLSITSLSLIAIILFMGCKKPLKLESETAPLAPSGPGYSSNLQNVDNLKVCSMIGQGKYGTVWKGLINEQAVAVKIFPGQYKQYFINERNIYSLPLMNNPSILTYFGCDERRTMDDNIEYFLVLSLAPFGCLQDWLLENSCSYSIFCKMAKSITRGLSHLHTEIRKGDELKPCICHRDLNTRNILVKPDLTCCISDFGFALKVFGSKYEYKGEVAIAETKSIAEVGTLRYMAPEILEGAVNLRDCETALKQIDVYSLGLVLWELCTRCEDLYPPGQNVPSYKMPYEAEIGKNPTFDQMQVLVSRHKARPLFPPGWGGGPSGKIARDTCEDCWDHDAEARLTALCAEERIQELSNLRPRSNMNCGPSPPLSANNNLNATLNANVIISPTRQKNVSSILRNGFMSRSDPITLWKEPQQQAHNNNFGNNNSTSCVTTSSRKNYFNSSTSPILVNLTGSPNTEKNHLICARQIQPFQGRNPCQERNLAPVQSRSNQILIEKSTKHSFRDRGHESSLSCLEDDISVEDLIATNASRKSDSTKDTIMGEGFPKQNNTDKKLRGWHGVRALIQKKLFHKGQSHVFSSNYDEKSNLVDNRVNFTVAPAKVVTDFEKTGNPTKLQIDMSSPIKDTRVNLVDTRNSVKHQNGHIQTNIESPVNPHPQKYQINQNLRRPNNLNVQPITVRVNDLSMNLSTPLTDTTAATTVTTTTESCKSTGNSNLIRNVSDDFNHALKNSSINSIANCNNSKLLNGMNKSPRLVISRSANAVKSLHNNNSTINSPSSNYLQDEKQITRQRSLEVFREVFSAKGSTERLRNPSQRVKTPGDVPPSVRKVRASKTLSLYDDRMMDSSDINSL